MVSFQCDYEIKETANYGDGDVIVPFVDGNVFKPFPLDNQNPLNGAFTFTSSDTATRCSMTHVLLYASEEDYKNNNPKANMPVLYAEQDITLNEQNQGKVEYFFAITGKKNYKGEYIRSNLGKATLYVCGKEEIGLT